MNTDLSALQNLWFVLIAVLWIGYLTLEGFDFGVGMLLPILGKGSTAEETNKKRRVMLNTIGPIWDGNEVWVLTAGGAMFAAFPQWYATLFSGYYLALALILIALILRNVGLDYRGKGTGAAWRSRFDTMIIGGSYAAALLWGVGLTNIVYGSPVEADPAVAGNYLFTGNLFNLLGIVPLLGGLTFVALFMTHGAMFLALKTEGEVREQAKSLSLKTGLVTAVLAVVLLLVLNAHHSSTVGWLGAVLAAVCLLAGLFMGWKGREGWAFIGTFATIAFAVVSYFGALYPNAMPSSLGSGPKYDLSLAAASSTPGTLTIMTWAAVIFTPIVLIYTSWTYYVFHKRIGVRHIPDEAPIEAGSRG